MDLGIKGVAYPQGLGGQWAIEGGVQALNVLQQPDVSVSARATYASPSGWKGFVGATLPITGAQSPRLNAGVSYSVFLATPTALADTLAGPDPSARNVRVVSVVDGVNRPLANIHLTGCNGAFMTDADGQVRITGTREACQVTVDAADLPAGLVFLTDKADVSPGGTVTFQAVTAGTLRGQVVYVDPETGAPLTDGPARSVHLNVDGPEARWVSVQLPGGRFELTGLKPGTYRVFLDGEASSSIDVSAGTASVTVRTLGPRTTVLAAEAITPSLRLTWGSVVLASGESPKLRVTAGAPLSSVDVLIGDHRFTYPVSAQQNPTDWNLTLPPPLTTGSVPVVVTAHFTNGAVAQRSTQIVVSPSNTP